MQPGNFLFIVKKQITQFKSNLPGVHAIKRHSDQSETLCVTVVYYLLHFIASKS